MPELIHRQMGQRSEEDNWDCVHVCVKWSRWHVWQKGMQGCWVERNRTRRKLPLRTPLASLLKTEKQTNETEGRGGPEGKTTPKDKERQRMKNE